MKLYLASSWRNKELVTHLDDQLLKAGHETFNFSRPWPGSALPNGFHWSEIDENWQSWSPSEYAEALDHRIAVAGFQQDMSGMEWAEGCVAIQPFGRSASSELGWFVGKGKPVFTLLADGEPELMLGMSTALCVSADELIGILEQWESKSPIRSPCCRISQRGTGFDLDINAAQSAAS